MAKKLTKIVGIKKEDFDEYVSSGEIHLRQARLIPFIKPGDEMALTAVLLSAIRLIKEFRRMIKSDIKMIKGGTIYVFTEVSFKKYPDSVIDGMILIEKAGIIKDSAIFEVKNGRSELDKKQIERYQKIARNLKIPKFITVSNQFVSEPTQFPLSVKTYKNIDLYHFSWSYLLTLAHILLFDNEINIEDEDQVEIMREVVKYLENDKSGVCGLNQMKPAWADVVRKINAGANIKIKDPDVREVVDSWHQEERDMALILSRHLGVLVNSGESKYKGNLQARINEDIRHLINGKQLISTLRVRGAVSDIKIIGLFEKRTVEMSVTLQPPSDKTLRGQLGWVKRQIGICVKKDRNTYEKLKNELMIGIQIKNMRDPERCNAENILEIYNKIKNKEIKEFKVILLKDFGKKYASPRKFVESIEEMLIDFYSGIIQYLSKWEPSAPKMKVKIQKPLSVEEDKVKEEPFSKIINEVENKNGIREKD